MNITAKRFLSFLLALAMVFSVVPGQAIHVHATETEDHVHQYTVRFLNEDGAELQSTLVDEGTVPEYTGEPLTKASDGSYEYTFAGWDADGDGVADELAPVTADVDYQALFAAEAVSQIAAEPTQGSDTGDAPAETDPAEPTPAETQVTEPAQSEPVVTEPTESTPAEEESPVGSQYAISFVDWDGTLLQEVLVNEGEVPVYTGAEPVVESDGTFEAKFAGWDVDGDGMYDEELDIIPPATADATYTAAYTVIELVEPEEAVGAVSGTLSVEGLGTTTSGGTWTATNGTTITGKVTGGEFFVAYSNTSTITLQNKLATTATLSFDWNLSNGGSVDVNGEYSTTTGHYTKEIAADGKISIKVTSPSGKNTNTLTISNIKLISTEAVAPTITFEPSAGGSYTVNATQKITANTPWLCNKAGEQLSLVATPNSGYQFYGWKDGNNGTYLSFNKNYTHIAQADITIVPEFISASTAVFEVGGARYFGLQPAIDAAVAGNHDKITLVSEMGTVSAGDYTIPAGVTLLIPYDDMGNAHTGTPVGLESYTTPSAFRTLTMESGAKIVVDGKLCIDGSQAAVQRYNGMPTGPLGFIAMNSGSSITVNSGGYLYAWGYITGSGSVVANSGATIYENFQLADFRGGTATVKMAGNSQRVFPMSQYYIQNIEVPLTLYAGAKEYGHIAVKVTGVAMQHCDVPVMGGSDAMFQISDGYIVKDYIENTGRIKFDTYGNISVSSIALSMEISAFGGTTTLNSADYYLSIPGHFTIHAHQAGNAEETKVNINQDIALLPGAKLYIDEGVNGTLASGRKVVLFDSDNWGNYVYNGNIAGGVDKYVALKYVPGGPGETGRNEDALVLINGTVDASLGAVYTTEGGANIYTEGSGKAIVAATAESTINEANQAGSDITYTGIKIIPAVLQNGANATKPTTSTAKAGTYKYCTTHITWYKVDESLEVGEKETTAPTCTTAGEKTITCDCGVTSTEAIPALGHNWGTAEYTWTDTTGCTATRTCTRDDSHKETATATISSKVTTPATCTEKGTTTYTATFDEDWATTQTKDVQNIDALDHAWTVSYQWSDDGKSCTATRACANDADHDLTETVTATGVETTPATCESMGTTTYTANFEADWAVDGQTKDVQDIAALNHAWTVSYDWSADGKSCTATRTCANNAAHNLTETVTATGAVKTPATCTVKGTTTYTANFAAEWAVDGQTKDVQDIDVIAHSYGTKRSDSLKTAATCEGNAVYYVQCDNCSAVSDSVTVEAPNTALGHDWGEPSSYTNNGANGHTAHYTCANDPSHTKSEADSHTYTGVNHTCACGEVEEYTVSWIVDGKENSKTTVDHGSKVTDIPAVPNKPGYTGEWNIPETITGNTEITATYIPNNYSVSWIVGDTAYESTVVVYDTNFVLPAAPTKTGHTFDGWYTGKNGTGEKITADTKYTFDTVTAAAVMAEGEEVVISGQTTLYANFTVNTYDVKWTVDGQVHETTQVVFGEEIIAPENPTKAAEGCIAYTFNKWDGFTEGMTLQTEGATFAAIFFQSIKHTSDEYAYSDNDNGTHTKARKCFCGVTVDEAHTYTYIADDDADTITETCDKGCGHSATITLKAPADLVYSGEPKMAQVTDNIEGEYGLEYSENPVKVGTYTATLTVGSVSVSLEYTIAKAPSGVTAAPTPSSDLVYTGEPLNLISKGETEDGTMVYSLTEDGEYTTSIPTATNAGDYTVWYKVVGDTNHTDSTAASITATIDKADASFEVSNFVENLVYNGEPQELVTAATTNDGEVQYSTDRKTWSTSIPTATDAGEYTVYYKIVGDANHNDSDILEIKSTISKKSVAEPTVTGEYIYNGKEQSVTLTGRESYMTVSGDAGTDAGSYEAVVTLDGNHQWAEGYDGKVQWTIAKAPLTITAKSYEVCVGAEKPNVGYTVEGLVNGETIEAALTQVPTIGFYYKGNAVNVDMSLLRTYDLVIDNAISYNYAITYVNGTLTVKNHVIDKTTNVCDNCGLGDVAVASVTIDDTTTYFATLDEAVAEASDGTAATLTLLKNIDLGPNFQTISGGVFTLDLNGHELKSYGSAVLNITGGTITIADSSENKTGAITATATGGWGVYVKKGTANISGGTITTTGKEGHGVYLYGGNATITGGTIKTTGTSAYGVYAQVGTANITGGTIESAKYGVCVSANGKAFISGGSISGDSADLYKAHSEYGIISLTLAEGKTEGATFPGGITVSGIVSGTDSSITLAKILDADAARYWGEVDGKAEMLTVDDVTATSITNKGTITIKAPCDHTGSQHTTATNNNDGNHTYTCTLCQNAITEGHTMDPATGSCICGHYMAVASVTINNITTHFETLDEAVDEAYNGPAGSQTTLTLLKDIDLGDDYQTISSGMFTIDLSGHKLESSAQYVLYITGGTITIADSDSSGTAGGIINTHTGTDDPAGAVYVAADGKVTVSNGAKIACDTNSGMYVQGVATIEDGATIDSKTGVSVEGTNASATITGGTITGETGVSVEGDKASATIKGGTITGSTGVSVTTNASAAISGGTISGNLYGVHVENGEANITGGFIKAGNPHNANEGDGVYVVSGTARISRYARIMGNRYGVHVENGEANITGGVILGTSADLYKSGGNITLGVDAETGIGATFPVEGISGTDDTVTGGITVGGTTLAEIILDTGASYWAVVDGKNTMLTVESAATAIADMGDITVRATCDHTGSQHTTATDNEDGTHTYTCTLCQNKDSEPHTMNPATGLCQICGGSVAVASVTLGDTTTYFETLGGAVTEASKGTADSQATLTLLKDIDLGTASQTISSGVFTLDLNDHKIESAADRVLNITGGTVNIADNGTDETKTGTISGGTTATETAYGVYVNGGTANISGGTIEVTAKNSARGVHVNGGTANISGGTIEATANKYIYGVYVASNGTANISGGTFTGIACVYVYGGTATITGGTITGTNYGVYAGYKGTVNIEGGTITGKAAGVEVYTATSTANISGGKITSRNCGVESVGTTTITGNAEITAGTEGVYAYNGEVTISGNARITAPYGVYLMRESAGKVAATIAGGTITATKYEGVFVSSNSSAKITGGTIESAKYGVYVASTGTATITGGKITGTSADLFKSGANGTITLTLAEGKTEGATFPGGITVSNGADSSITLKDILGTGASYWAKVDEKDTMLTEYGATEITGKGDITVRATCKHPEESRTDYQKKDDTQHTYFCEGCQNTIPENHIFDSTDGKCICGYEMAVASVTLGDTDTTTYFETLGEAVDAVKYRTAEHKAVVKLLKDIDLGTASQAISSGVFTIDLNDHELKSSGEKVLNITGGTVTIADNGTDETKTGTISGGTNDITTAYGVYVNGGTAKITGGTIEATANYYAYGVHVNGGTANISGGTITATGTISGYGVYVSSANASATITGGTIEATANTSARGVFVNGGTANISGGTITGGTIEATATETAYGVYAYQGEVTISGDARITAPYGVYIDGGTTSKAAATIEGGTITSTYIDGYGVFVSSNSSAKITGGTIESARYGVYVASTGTATISGGKITGDNYGVYLNGGTTTITDGTIEATGAGGNGVNVSSGGTATISGGKITSSDTGVSVNSSTATITGGTIEATGHGVYATGENTSVTISGGTITGTVTDLYNDGTNLKLTLGENGADGATFPGGIFVGDTTLKDILGTGASYWAVVDGKNTMVIPADGQTEITGKGTITVKAACDHPDTEKDYTDNADGETHSVICQNCQNVVTAEENHSYDANYLCICGYDKHFTVTFHANYETESTMEPQSIGAVKATALNANTFQRTGYAFLGWSTNPDATTAEYADFQEITLKQDTKLYAIWEAGTVNYFVETYTMTTGGITYAGPEKQNFTAEADAEISVTPEVPEGFTLNTKKSILSGTAGASGGTILKVYLDRIAYTVTYKVDGNDYASKTWLYGADVEAVANPEKIGYTFSGWQGVPETMPAKDVTVTGTFTANTYDAIFHAGDGAWADGEKTKTVSTAFDAEIKAPADPARKGYTFTGWDPKVGTMNDVNGKTFTAQWSANIYKATFNANEGAWAEGETDIVSQTYDANLTLPATQPTRKHYNFIGWFTAAEGGEQVTAETVYATADDTTYYAHWTLVEYTLILKPGAGAEGENIISTFTIETQGDLPFSESTFSKEGHNQNYWTPIDGDKDALNGVESYAKIFGMNVIDENNTATLYARWLVSSYNVDIIPGGDGENKNSKYKYGTSLEEIVADVKEQLYSDADFRKTGHDWTGWAWFTDEAGTTPYEGTTLPDYPLYLIGQWTANTYNAIFNAEGGQWADGDTSKTVRTVFGDDIAAPAAPTRVGYTFAGWDKEVGTMDEEGITFTAQWRANTYKVKLSESYSMLAEIVDAPVMATYDQDLRVTLRSTGSVKRVDMAGVEMGGTTYGNIWTTETAENGDLIVTIPATWINKVEEITGRDKEIALQAYGGVRLELDLNGGTLNNSLFDNRVHSLEVNGDQVIVEQRARVSNISLTAGYYNAAEVAEKTGHTFAGVKLNGSDEVVSEIPTTADCKAEFQWEANTYYVTFHANGGAMVNGDTSIRESIVFGTNIKVPEEPTREHYTFAGWFTAAEGGEQVTAETVYATAGDTTYYAHWTPVKYTLILKPGTGAKGEDITYTFTIETQDNLSSDETGYSKVGHYQNYWTPVDGDTDLEKCVGSYAEIFQLNVIEENNTATLYARWVPHTHTVYGIPGGSGEEKNAPASYGDSLAEIKADMEKRYLDATFEKTGYTFSGWAWFTNEAGTTPYEGTTMPDHDLYLIGQWTANSYKAVFDANGGQWTDGEKTKTGPTDFDADIIAPADPVREGYTFAGWSPEVGKMDDINGKTFTAQWQANTYDAIFNAEGGQWADGDTSKTVPTVFGDEIAVPDAEPTRVGYTFAGWDKEVDTMDEEGITFTAQWRANSYNAVFDANGGQWTDGESPVSTKTVPTDFDADIIAPADPVREGYTFAGWSPEVGKMDDVNGKTFTAQWRANSYEAVFDANGGQWTDGDTRKTVPTDFDAAIIAPADPVREGYTFAGWSPEVGKMDDINGKTLTATWNPVEYTLILKPGTGAEGEVQTFPFTIETEGKLPSVTGYSKVGHYQNNWTPADGDSENSIVYYSDIFDKAKDSFTADNTVTLYARWMAKPYTVHYIPGGNGEETGITFYYGKDLAEIEKHAQDYYQNVTFEKTGYTFSGWAWFTDKAGTTPYEGTTLPAQDLYLIGQWTANSYNAVFDANGGQWTDGDTSKTVSTVFDTAIVAPAKPERTGHMFTGWSPEVGTMNDVNGKTFTAQWRVNSYEAVFDANGGAWANGKATETVITVFGTKIAAPAAPARTGYTFTGWDKEVGTMDEEGITFTAQWSANSYEAVFNANGGQWTDGESPVSTKTVPTDFDADIIAPADPVREGYTFAGWDLTVGKMDDVNGKTFTAQWKANSYEAVFDANGGQWTDGDTRKTVPTDFDAAIIAPADPAREGYTFAGWDLTVGKMDDVNGITFTAQWTPNKYTVTWAVNGKEYKMDTVTYGETIPVPADPVRDQFGCTTYTFDKWDAEIPDTMPAQNLRFTAIFTKGENHAWSVRYDWSEDGKTCTATRVCGRDEAHNLTETVTATGAEKTPATCTEKGWTTYTAAFEADWAESQTKDVQDIPALEHDWTVSYDWSEDGKTCTAKRVCGNDAKHNLTATAKISSAVKTPAACESMGTTTYTATFSETWATTQTKDVQDIPALKHDWTVSYQWSDDGKTCTATRACGNDAAHNLTATGKITSTVKTKATCTEMGTTTYTATFNAAWAETQTKDVQDIPALEHAWTVSYDWSEDGKTCTATRVCGNDAEHNETATGKVTSTVKTEATCEDMGWTTYTAAFEADWAETQTKDVQDIPALKHDWTVSYNWSEDGKTCTATRTCGNDAAHNLTATGKVTSVIKTEATCTEKGWTTYTATFEADWAETQTKDVQDIPALDHAWTVSYQWSDDGKSCTATRTCGNDAAHNLTATGKVTSVIKTEATCTEKGWTTYTATFDADWAETQTKDVQDIPALKHDWVLKDYTVTDETHTANYVCGNDSAHTKSGETENHTYTGEDHKCICGAVEQITVRVFWQTEEPVWTLVEDYGTVTSIPTGPAPEGHSFAGFARSKGGEVFLTKAEYTYTESIDLYPVFTVNSYTVTFTVNGETWKQLTFPYGEAVTAPDYTVPAGHTFSGWTLPDTMPAEDIALDAVLTVNKYPISWDTDGDGTIDSTEDVAYGTVPTAPEAAKAADGTFTYTFSHWDKEIVAVTGEASYCAIFVRTGWLIGEEGRQYLILDQVQKTGWTEIGTDWYYLDPETGYAATGVSRVPYPATAIEGVTYAPAEEIAQDPCDGFELDKTSGLFLFDEETGRFQSETTGMGTWLDATRYAEKGHIAWHPGLVLENGDYYYFLGDETLGGNILTTGDVYMARNNTGRDVVIGGIYTFSEEDGKLCEYDGITEVKGILRYYEDARLMIGNGLTKVGDEFIYVRYDGSLVVNNSYWVGTNDLGVAEGVYFFNENGFLVFEEVTLKEGVYREGDAWYYYEQGARVFNRGLIEVTDVIWHDADGSETPHSGIIYIRSNGKLVTGNYYITNISNYEGEGEFQISDYLIFDELGLMNAIKNGIYAERGTLYYYQNNVIAYNAGVIQLDGNYYYVRSNGEVVHGKSYWITNVGDSGVIARCYAFDDNGVMQNPAFVLEQGIVNGYYYINGNIAYGAGLVKLSDENGEFYIYVKSNGQLATGKYWPTTTNGYDVSGMLDFGAEGKYYI